ncbi:calmodulin-binding protein [Striga asiatica]|uniref:Calmodulin-binding protein n=1 Tax=Striga asiatica TaxID=4170 RepID=A0A5A7RET8_STRAF|nr:calmodulin-binding protein [Striga asiatica]
MVTKRPLGEGAEEGSRLPFKRRHNGSSLLRGVNHGRILPESASCLEPMIRRIVREAINHSIGPYLRISENQVTLPRKLELRFCNNLPQTLFTNSRVQSKDKTQIKVALCDSTTKEVISCGPHSSLKATLVVLDGDFGAVDREDWTAEEFDRKLVKNREGRRPLLTGELAVSLHNGVGYIGDVSFTDNSSWIRSGKFCLGVKALASSAEKFSGIKEAFSTAFKVKDHRGESYKKHHPPCLDDEVWRLEKIAKDGPSHKSLTQFGIHCVRDFLKIYFMDRVGLRTILHKVTNKAWETIVEHAQTCTLDDKKYIYTTAQGTGLLFTSTNKVIGVTFDGRNYLSLDNLNTYQMEMLEHMKQQAYENSSQWVEFHEPTSILGCPMLFESPATDTCVYRNIGLNGANFHEQEINSYHPTMSPIYNAEPEQDNCSFEFGESSNSSQGLNPTFKNISETDYSPVDFFTGEESMWASGGNYTGPQLSTDDLPLDNGFQVESPGWQGNGSFFHPGIHEVGIISSSSERWCKILAVVKWRILVKRNVAARKWKSSFGYVPM